MNYYIKGTKNLIKAFTEELIELGYKHDWDNIYSEGDFISVCTQDKTYIIDNNNNNINHIITHALPEQWNEALEAIKKIKPKIPEYVQVISVNVNDQFTIGKIYKIDLDNSSEERYRVEKDDSENVNGWSSGNFIPSTKEAWEEQKNKPKLSIGDFYIYNDDLRYIWKIDDKCYYFKDEINNGNSCNYIEDVDSHKMYSKVSDEKALELLKKHYAKKGIVVGAWMRNLVDNCKAEIIDFKLRKNVELFDHKEVVIGESQLAYQLDGGYWYTADSNWEVVEKVQKLFGYDVKIEGDEIKVGCQTYTKNTVELLLDIANGYSDKTVSWYSKILDNTADVTSKQLEEILKLFND